MSTIPVGQKQTNNCEIFHGIGGLLKSNCVSTFDDRATIHTLIKIHTFVYISVILEINVTAPRRLTLVPGDHVFNVSSRHEVFFSAAHRLNCDLDISIIYCRNLLSPHLLQLYYYIETVNCKLFPFTHLLFMEHKLKKMIQMHLNKQNLKK